MADFLRVDKMKAAMDDLLDDGGHPMVTISALDATLLRRTVLEAFDAAVKVIHGLESTVTSVFSYIERDTYGPAMTVGQCRERCIDARGDIGRIDG